MHMYVLYDIEKKANNQLFNLLNVYFWLNLRFKFKV